MTISEAKLIILKKKFEISPGAIEGGISMRKYFCDHCGKEIKGNDINELCCDDCFYDTEIQEFVGAGCTLCEKCWDERKQAHINLDMKFLRLVEEGME